MKFLTALSLALLLPSLAAAQGDTCATAEAISTLGPRAFDTTLATSSGFNAGLLCGAGGEVRMRRDGFWRLTAPVTGTYRFDVADTLFIASIAVYRGSGCTPSCEVFEQPGTNASNRVVVHVPSVSAGEVLLIQVGSAAASPSGGVGVLTIEAAPTPPGDGCATAVPMNAPTTFSVDTRFASTSGFNGAMGTCGFGANEVTGDLFFDVTATVPGDYVFRTIGATFDSVLNVHKGIGCSAICFRSRFATSSDQARIKITDVQVGDRFLVQYGTDRPTQASGTATILIDTEPPPVGDTCDQAIPISGAGPFYADNSYCTRSNFEGGVPCDDSPVTRPRSDMFFQYTVPADGNYAFSSAGSDFGSIIFAHRGTGCSATCVSAASEGANPGRTAEVAGLLAGEQVLLQVGTGIGTGFVGGYGIIEIEVRTFTQDCPDGGSDIFEPNNVCASAMPLSVDTFERDLVVSFDDPDIYELQIPPGQAARFVAAGRSGTDIDLVLFGNSCMQTGAQTAVDVDFWNRTDSVVSKRVGVFVDPAQSANQCSRYTLSVDFQIPSCPTYTDAYEPNDDCMEAAQIGDGRIDGLTVFSNDDDFFQLEIAPGGRVVVDALFDDEIGNVTLYLWLASAVCGDFQTGTPLDSSLTQTDNERVEWLNSSSVTRSVVVQVRSVGISGPLCNVYDLVVSGSATGALGDSYCMANANSTGAIGSIVAEGAGDIAANDVQLRASGLPNGSFGFFLCSQTQGFVANAGGSAGNLCLLGSIGRFVAMDEIREAGEQGTVRLAIDLTALPQPTSSVPVLSGETWNFQYWHRDTDAAGPTSNFTNGRSVTFP